MASASAATAAKPKPKPKKALRCKPGQARLRIGKRTICVAHSLPSTHAESPQVAFATASLRLGLGKVRDRLGRRSHSLSQLLGRVGPRARADLERAVATGLTEGEALARGARAARRGASIAESSGCGSATPELPGPGSKKVGEAEVTLGLEAGAISVGIDLKGKGVGISVQLRSCGDDGIHLDAACPTAEGTLEGHGHDDLQASFRVTEGATLVLAQSFVFGGETTVKAQTGDDGKLDGYDIKHVYKMVGSFGGTKAKFGPITVDTTYIGEAHVDMRGGSGAPPPAEVDVMLSMAGADPAERIATEIKLARESQAQADKEFSAVVEKATKQLRDQEGVWLTPNKCASIRFEPASESLHLHKGDTGTFKSRTEAKGGGAPATASWTLGAQQNATFTPSGSEGNPLSSAYSVTSAGKGLLVSATLKATSKAGVAEVAWKQPTTSVVQTLTGSFGGRDERGGETFKWTATATFTRIPTSVEGTSILEPSSTALELSVSGTDPAGCTVTGEEEVGVFGEAPISVLGEAAPGVLYDLDVPFGGSGLMKVVFSACPTPHGEGDGPGTVSVPAHALLSGDPFSGGPTALLKTSSDGVSFAGSASGVGTEPGETASWNWSFTATS